MSALLSRVQTELNAARKAQDKSLTLLLGTILSDIRNREIELRRELGDEDVIEVIGKGIKRRRESIEMYTAGQRDDLAGKEATEVRLLEAYLPAQASSDDIRVAVRAAIAAGAGNVGAVMGKVMPQFKGRAEGGQISAIAKAELSGTG
ncbi:MAG: GatB/YqeY domain-containing protein [Gemmatimonadaceae bacterium]